VEDVSLDAALKVSSDVVFRELDGEAIVLNLATGVYFGLDPVGTRMWQLIDQRGRLQDVVTVMCDEYDAPAAQIERDLVALVAELVRMGLMCRADASRHDDV